MIAFGRLCTLPAPTVLKVVTPTPPTPLTTVSDAAPDATVAGVFLLLPTATLITTKAATTTSTDTTAPTETRIRRRCSLRAWAARIAATLASVCSRRCFLVSRSATSAG